MKTKRFSAILVSIAMTITMLTQVYPPVTIKANADDFSDFLGDLIDGMNDATQKAIEETFASVVESSISISDATCPTGTLALGKPFTIKGVISSNKPITKVWGGVYYTDGSRTAQYCEKEPYSYSYSLSEYFDYHLIFNDLQAGDYLYRIEAQDDAGFSKVLVESRFSIAANPSIADVISDIIKEGMDVATKTAEEVANSENENSDTKPSEEPSIADVISDVVKEGMDVATKTAEEVANSENENSDTKLSEEPSIADVISDVVKEGMDVASSTVSPSVQQEGPCPKVQKAVNWAIEIANDPSHGYDQAHKWGPEDYDCSGLVISAFKNAGVDTGNAIYTGNMCSELSKHGFSVINFDLSLLQYGDILIWHYAPDDGHTELYIGDGQMVGAHINEKNDITGGQPGDQTGNEISLGECTKWRWQYILRYDPKWYDWCDSPELPDNFYAFIEFGNSVLGYHDGNIQLESETGAEHQVWHFVRERNDIYNLSTNGYSGTYRLCQDDTGAIILGSTSDDSSCLSISDNGVQETDYNSCPPFAQRFSIRPISDPIIVEYDYGESSCPILEVHYGEPYYGLIDITTPGFIGWYTEPEGGEKIDPYKVSIPYRHTLYAHYSLLEGIGQVIDQTVDTAKDVINNPDLPTESTDQIAFSGAEPIAAIKELTGDVNKDNSVDAKDLILLRRHLTGWDVQIDKSTADINNDDSIDLKDVVLLRRILVDKISLEEQLDAISAISTPSTIC